ncbi:hypothetical protein WK30_23555 [Burkholderia vietnamiensis]|nr:hypothetical protein WJ57_08330 [Burkholderia vietnamiensis]KVR98448.1 hypothetical protein WK30_23555 [Burkholderia vietnamiensis]
MRRKLDRGIEPPYTWIFDSIKLHGAEVQVGDAVLSGNFSPSRNCGFGIREKICTVNQQHWLTVYLYGPPVFQNWDQILNKMTILFFRMDLL